MQPAHYPGPAGKEEFALVFDSKREKRVLVIPAVFDEANRLRRFSVEVMRRLDRAGHDSFLPDLPGCHESLVPLAQQTLGTWREAAALAARRFAATHVLAIRGGALVAPPELPGWRYAPTTGSNILRALLRARIVSSREAGLEEKADELLAKGRTFGMTLVGFRLGPEMVSELEHSRLADNGRQQDIAQAELGGGGLWLRAEPGDDSEQANTLAAMIIRNISA